MKGNLCQVQLAHCTLHIAYCTHVSSQAKPKELNKVLAPDSVFGLFIPKFHPPRFPSRHISFSLHFVSPHCSAMQIFHRVEVW